MSTSTADRVACEPRTAFVLGTPNPPTAAVTLVGLWLAGPDVETDPQD